MLWIKRILITLTSIFVILVVVYLLGPRPETPVYVKDLPVLPAGLPQLDSLVNSKESKLSLKPDNEARIVWADSTKKEQTEYAVVYLHGFTASEGEGDPVHRNFAKKFGCNLYLARLAGHGLKDPDAMVNFTADNLWASGREAYAIGKKLGKKVIIMGTSTGGTLALKLAATYPEINGLILYSPNIEINDDKAWMMNDPWGLQIARYFIGGKYSKKTNDTDPKVLQYWYSQYRLEALPQLEEFMETSNIPEAYEKVKQPVLMLYYYKDATHQDPTTRVPAMLKMFGELGTDPKLKRKVAIPNAGAHVIASPLLSKDVPAVERETEHFAVDVLGMPLVKK
ncbi:alpha/beta hydrolase [Pedobacter nutrimenti]|uniref:alpha/beta hydrolase n=1 Tax=Pedobacter nutrimenti TaxID=1241337 RepID=UPI00292FAD25|nr:alpha/beta hydrolase [Pedobacter nutrimenti]